MLRPGQPDHGRRRLRWLAPAFQGGGRRTRLGADHSAKEGRGFYTANTPRHEEMRIGKALTFAALLAVEGAIAQSPQVTTVWPPGGMRGTKVAARIEGSGLGAVTSVLVAGRGVAVNMGQP